VNWTYENSEYVKKLFTGTLISLLTLLSSFDIDAQEVDYPSLKLPRNSINAYIGLFEVNINYERNIIQRPKSHTNIRMGFGKAMFLNAGIGSYVNPSLVHIFGKGNSHLELDLGFKYMIINGIENPSFSDTFISDFFAGYRYEKPNGKFIFRAGNNYPTFINIGIGGKF